MILSCQTCLFFWGNSPVFRSFWVGHTIPDTLHVRLCDAVRILGCLSKRVIGFGVPRRRKFGSSLCAHLLRSPSEKGTRFLSHLVLVGAVIMFAEVREKEEKRCISISDWFQVWSSDMVKCYRKFSPHLSLNDHWDVCEVRMLHIPIFHTHWRSSCYQKKHISGERWKGTVKFHFSILCLFLMIWVRAEEC